MSEQGNATCLIFDWPGDQKQKNIFYKFIAFRYCKQEYHDAAQSIAGVS